MASMPMKLRRATPDEQFAEVTRGVVDLYVEAELRDRLRHSFDTGAPLCIKTGFDPTAPDLHIGHTVLLSRMRRFQDFGHRVIFLIGDFTGMIGDPTGRNATRPPLSREQVLQNAETYKAQVFKVLSEEETEVRFNSEWLGPMSFADVVRLASRYTLARMLERDDFRRRYVGNSPIGVHELLYPLAQGYDSVALRCDVELGSSDQLFNLMVGRTLMQQFHLPPQVVLTGPMLEGTDAQVDPSTGKVSGNKMSKSLGNYVGVAETPTVQFGKLMSICDELMWRYYDLLSQRSTGEIASLRRGHPRAAKVALAREIVERFHGTAAAREAEDAFERVHARREAPLVVDERVLPLGDHASLLLVAILEGVGLAASRGAARRLVAQGGVTVNGARISDARASFGAGNYLVKVGKRHFARIRIE